MLALALCPCAPDATERATTLTGLVGMNVVILTLDACRADRLGAYGYERDTSPSIDALAADPDAVVFRHHYVNGASTKPSTATLFTGLRVHEHGIHAGVIPTRRSKTDRRYDAQSLNPDFLTLAEAFRAAGFETFGVVKSHHLIRDYGFDQGFDRYLSPKEIRRDDHRVRKALELFGSARGRFFGYVHLNACHHPFMVRERNPEFMREYGFPYPEAERIRAGIDFTTPDIKFAARRGELELTGEDQRFLSLVYDAQLRRVDQTLVAPFLAGLRDLAIYDDTLLILTADHGEELFEHRGYAHGHAVWEEITHVPLIVKFPAGLAPEALGRNVDGLTGNIDIMPSLLALLGRRVPESLPGVPILSGSSSRHKLLGSGRYWGVVGADLTKLVGPRRGKPMLFDLRADPGERRDVAAREPARVTALRAFADAAYASGSGAPAPLIERELDPEAVEQLRGLGYIE